jgi:hypothetical protein
MKDISNLSPESTLRLLSRETPGGITNTAVIAHPSPALKSPNFTSLSCNEPNPASFNDLDGALDLLLFLFSNISKSMSWVSMNPEAATPLNILD